MGVPPSTVTATFAHISKTTPLAMVERVGSGKTASAYMATTPGGHRRVVRVVVLPEGFAEGEYRDISRTVVGLHEYIHTLMPTRTPKLHSAHLIPSKRGTRTLAMAYVMSWIGGDVLGGKPLSDRKAADLRTLLRQLWSNRISHGDLFHGNLLYSDQHRRWMLIDLDNLRMHRSSQEARNRDMGMMDPLLKDLLR